MRLAGYDEELPDDDFDTSGVEAAAAVAGPQKKHPLAEAFERAAMGGDELPVPVEEFDMPASFGSAPSEPTAPPMLQAPPKPDRYESALGDVRRIAAERGPQYDIAALTGAQERDRANRKRDNFTAALSAALLRKPYQAPASTEANDMMAIEGLKVKQATGDQQRRLGAAETIARALRGEKQPGAGARYDDPYHRALAEQAASLVEERKRKAQADQDKAAREGGELEALRREAGRQLPGVNVEGLGGEDLRNLIKAKDARERARILAAAKAKAGEDGRPLAPGSLSELADVDVAQEELDRLGQKFDDLGMSGLGGKVGGRVTEALGLQDTDSASYIAERRRVAQSVGKILEGGKLAAGDEVKYEQMLPRPGDTPEIRQQKIDGLKRMLADVKSKREQAYSAGGYKVPKSTPARGKGNIQPSTATVTLRDKTTGRRKTVPRSMADEILASPDGADFEEVPDGG